MICKKCKQDWDEDYFSNLALFPEGDEELDLKRADIEQICNDCRNKLWVELYA